MCVVSVRSNHCTPYLENNNLNHVFVYYVATPLNLMLSLIISCML
jgi:hypothetical protein